ncbi:P-loop containing nucleoside triphosphate hydrolase protein [Fimicolochytrium jonesii]|uniref:P-loop containing nucleoside triphosphate hydrolase protein n=1 Tax=Fimicolochytrium jonesii TaxID=1396493 RepID=UPI0022FEFACB|nr:P-loop containing nucleoside triphosphate hydrolase protein [Fimicolochytrium jonesii]KAI8824374.1 P-loop containing nucleoside triphosphate hydrolase protein [Fimicolochytrium jonesii]
MSELIDLVERQCRRWLEAQRNVQDSTSNRPFIVGISGPQGSGKTTLTRELEQRLARSSTPLTAVSLSLDDFYLTYDEQEALAAKNPENDLLRYRGNPGTHDVPLAMKTLNALVAAHTDVRIPRYDKGLRAGRGDRLPFEQWDAVSPPFDVVLLEGWCVGFECMEEGASLEPLRLDPFIDPPIATLLPHVTKYPSAHIQLLNEYLRKYHALWKWLDVLVHICASDINDVYLWRKQQEEALRKSATHGRGGLSDSEVEDFVDRFMPGYLIGLRSLQLSVDLGNRKLGGYMRVTLDVHRSVNMILIA